MMDRGNLLTLINIAFSSLYTQRGSILFFIGTKYILMTPRDLKVTFNFVHKYTRSRVAAGCQLSAY